MSGSVLAVLTVVNTFGTLIEADRNGSESNEVVL